jgi:ADP-ribosylarginine hydrolase
MYFIFFFIFFFVKCIIAYDALLGSTGNWKEFCLRGILHGGDNDSTGAIGAAWFGAFYGFKGVPEINYKNIEYRDRLEKLANELYLQRKS